MRVFVTGATGFLGSYLIPVLLEMGCEVTTAVRPGSNKHLKDTREIELDFTLDNWCGKLPRDVDSIIHLAQSRLYRGFPYSALDIFNVNVLATMKLLDHARQNGIHKLIIASTGSIYSEATGLIKEDAIIAPSDYYASSKYAAELLASHYMEHIDICIFRIFRLYGQGQSHALIPNLISSIKDSRPITLSGYDGIKLTPTHVKDAAEIFGRALLEDWSGVINLSAPYVITLRDMCEKIGLALGKKPRFNILPAQGNIVPDLQRLSSHYPVETMRSFEHGLHECL